MQIHELAISGLTSLIMNELALPAYAIASGGLLRQIPPYVAYEHFFI